METKAIKKTIDWKNLAGEGALLVLLVLLVIVFSILSPVFFTKLNLTNILIQNVHVAIAATAVMLLMISGSMDLSVGYQVSTSSVLCCMMMTKWEMSPVLAVIACIACATLLGTFNGLMSRILRAHPMMITLGTMAIFQGVSYLLSNSRTYYGLPTGYLFLGQGSLGPIPFNAILAAVIILITGFILAKTYIGRYVYAVGDNPEASRLVGINVAKVKLLVFVVAGVLIGISAILLSSRNGSADSTTGLGIEFTGITACVLAGCSLKGGTGKLWKVIVAVYVLGVLSNGMQLVGLGIYPQYIAKGIIMLLSIYLSGRSSKSGMMI